MVNFFGKRVDNVIPAIAIQELPSENLFSSPVFVNRAPLSEDKRKAVNLLGLTEEPPAYYDNPMVVFSTPSGTGNTEVAEPDDTETRMNTSRAALNDFLANQYQTVPFNGFEQQPVEPVGEAVAEPQAPVAPGTEPLPETNDPWYGRIAGTVKNILSMSGDFAEKLTEKTPTGTVLSDWVNNFAASPFLAMPRNEVFQRMQAQANANLDREAKRGRTGSEAGALQIYKHFLGELDSTRPDLTVAEKQEIAYKKMVESLHAGRSNITIGGEAGPKWMGDINKKRYEDLSSASENADMMESMADELIKGIESGEFTTGGGDLGALAIRTANALGLSSGAQQRYSALFNSFSMERRKNLLSSFKGSISNKEQEIITAAIGDLGSSPQANLTFLKLAKLAARLARESRAKFSELTNLGLNDAQIDARFNDYLNGRASTTAEEVAAIMGNKVSANGSKGTRLEVVE